VKKNVGKSLIGNFTSNRLTDNRITTFCKVVSLALYDVADYHVVLRALKAVEMLTHRHWYDASLADSVNPLRNLPEIIMPAYIDLCGEITTLGHSCDITVVLALSAVVGFLVYLLATTMWITNYEPIVTVSSWSGVDSQQKKTTVTDK